MTLDPVAEAVAQRVKGFMPDDEGAALLAAGCDAGALGPLLEVGSYCGKSAIYLGSAARRAGTVLFTIDHHRGSEETQPGWEHHDPEVVDSRTGRTDTLPFLRRTLEDAALEDAVIVIVGDSPTVARHWQTPLGLLFIDGGHSLDVAMADYAGWAPHIAAGGVLAIHDVFEDPADGGQAPFSVWQRAVSDGFTPVSTTGSLRLLRA
jgi:predicted O-methyltransferase YrrM